MVALRGLLFLIISSGCEPHSKARPQVVGAEGASDARMALLAFAVKHNQVVSPPIVTLTIFPLLVMSIRSESQSGYESRIRCQTQSDYESPDSDFTKSIPCLSISSLPLSPKREGGPP